jgi:hypothetical protein
MMIMMVVMILKNTRNAGPTEFTLRMCASSTQQNITDGGADMYSTTRQELEFGL